jgi:aminopeptidase C
MKKLIQIVIAIAISATTQVYSQTVVKANDLLKRIDNNEALNISNAIIEGDLDLTKLTNNKKVKGGNWLSSDATATISIKHDFKFKDCEFTGNVIGYYNDEDEDILYKVDFEKRFHNRELHIRSIYNI